MPPPLKWCSQAHIPDAIALVARQRSVDELPLRVFLGSLIRPNLWALNQDYCR